MIPQNFEYSAPANLQEALGLLSGENVRVLAGGMSLIPLMKLRLAAPEQLVDLGRIPDLNTIREDKGSLRIGATTTHYQVESSALVRSRCPLLAEAASHIGDIQVRNMAPRISAIRQRFNSAWPIAAVQQRVADCRAGHRYLSNHFTMRVM